MKKSARADYPFLWQFDRSRHKDLYLMSQVREEQVQQSIIDFLGRYQVDAAPIDAGGRRIRGRMIATAESYGLELGAVANVKVGRGIPAGFADLEATLAPSGRALYIEVKAPAWLDREGKEIRAAGKPSAEQLEFLFEKHRRGALVLVAWSWAEVLYCVGETLLAANRRALEAKR
jgi:hypothetical protein